MAVDAVGGPGTSGRPCEWPLLRWWSRKPARLILGLGRELGLNRGLAPIACGSMPEDDSVGSTDLSDVFLRAMATPFIRPIAVWIISVAGVLPCLLIHALADDTSWVHEDDFWLIVLGSPLSFIGSLGQGLDGALWVNKDEYAAHRASYEPWEYSAVRVYTLRILLPAAALLWVRAAFLVCVGRRITSGLCQLFIASFFITSGRLEHLWWVGVALSAAMVTMYWNLEFFRRIRLDEVEFERDGI